MLPEVGKQDESEIVDDFKWQTVSDVGQE